ncbi:MAG: hypothetical protein ACTSPY_09940 [Candidatus Helarchaeota archaeon]
MKMKIKRKYLILGLLIFIPLYSIFITPINADFSPMVKSGQIYTWKIENISSGVIQYWDMNFPWTYHGSINASANSSIKFTTMIIGVDISGLFVMGNFSIVDNDSNIASVLNLGFGMWNPVPWFEGFFSETNWSKEIANANNLVNFTAGDTLTITNDSNRIKFEYKQGDGGNLNATLIYNMTTGVLLEAYVEIFMWNEYYLGITYVSVSDVTNVIGIETWIPIITGIISVSIIYIYLKYKLKRILNRKNNPF